MTRLISLLIAFLLAQSAFAQFEYVDYEWIDISTIGTPAGIVSDDHNVGPFELGFDLTFYDLTYSNVRMCSNGWASFTSTAESFENRVIPDTAEPNAALYVFWDDLYPPSGGSFYYFADVTNQRFIMSWINVPHFTYTSERYTFQVVLNANGDIRYNYQSVAVGGTYGNSSCTVGTESANGFQAVQVCFNGQGTAPTSESSILISPQHSAFLLLQRPTELQAMPIFHTDSISWIGVGFEGGVSILLNRHYPIGAWEVITNSTENDGEYEWFVTDPLSDSCRIRICAVQDTFCDISDGNFSIVSSQGYLALVKSSAPNSPVLSWNAGPTECQTSRTDYFRLKNIGSDATVVYQPLEPPTAEFTRTTSCGSIFALAPNQMSTCSLELSFAPSADGDYFDTLRVQTDAVNGVGGYVKIPLSGEQISTPASPEVVILPQGSSARLMWDPITESVGECPVTVTHYLVFYSPTEEGPYYYHGLTSDTTYVHTGVIAYAPAMFYTVTPMTGAIPLLLRDLEPGAMTREEVMEKIPIYKFQIPVQN